MTEVKVFANKGTKLVGKIITTERGSYFVQTKRVPKGACYNVGMVFPTTKES